MNREVLPDHVIDRSEQEAVLDQPDPLYPNGHRNLTMIKLLLELGLRVSELVELNSQDVDTSRGTLTVTGEHPVHHREFLLSDRLLHLIRGWRERQKAGWLRQQSSRRKEAVPEPLFTELSGDPLTESNVRDLVADSLKNAGIAPSGMHNVLRYTFATELYLDIGDIDRVHQVLGHTEGFVTVTETRNPVHGGPDIEDTKPHSSPGASS